MPASAVVTLRKPRNREANDETVSFWYMAQPPTRHWGSIELLKSPQLNLTAPVSWLLLRSKTVRWTYCWYVGSVWCVSRKVLTLSL